MSIWTTFRPRIDVDALGKPIRAEFVSRSEPGRVYTFRRDDAGHWKHTDEACPRGSRGLPCYHVEVLEALDDEGESHE